MYVGLEKMTEPRLNKELAKELHLIFKDYMDRFHDRYEDCPDFKRFEQYLEWLSEGKICE